jgi:hypothetical protein
MAPPSDTPLQQTPFETLLSCLTEGRDAAIRARKAKLTSDFATAKRLLSGSYRDYAPEELPVDIERLRRDLVISRDQAIDEQCDEIDRAYRIAIEVLRLVADRHPSYYEACGKAVGIRKSRWRAELLRRRPSGPRPAMPVSVLQGLTAAEQIAIVRALTETQGGASVRDLSTALGCDGHPGKHRALKRMLGHLVKIGHVTTAGKTFGVRYTAAPTLATFVNLMQTGTEPSP